MLFSTIPIKSHNLILTSYFKPGFLRYLMSFNYSSFYNSNQFLKRKRCQLNINPKISFCLKNCVLKQNPKLSSNQLVKPNLSPTSLNFNFTLAPSHSAKKRTDKEALSKKDGFLNVSGYGIAQFINLNELRIELKNDKYDFYFPTLPHELSNEVILVCKKYNSSYNTHWDAFIFSNGVIIFWNMPEAEHKDFIQIVRPFSQRPLDLSVIEREDLRYCLTKDKTRLVGEDIYLQINETRNEMVEFNSSMINESLIKINTQTDHTPQLISVDNSILLEQFAFSDALALSVKLSLLEYGFDVAAEEIEPWIENMKTGFGHRFRQSAVLRKTGELYTLKHLLNVSTTLIETPDFYWERPEIENLFLQLKSVLSVSSRTKILNSRLDMCCELTEILSNHLRSTHSSRLEKMIILLIFIEIIFEVLYYYESHQQNENTNSVQNEI